MTEKKCQAGANDFIFGFCAGAMFLFVVAMLGFVWVPRKDINRQIYIIRDRQVTIQELPEIYDNDQ